MTTEEIVLRLKPSRISFLKEYILAIFLLLFLFFIRTIISVNEIGIIVALVLVFIFIISPEITRARKLYIIAEDKVIIEQGIVSKRRRSILFVNVADVSVEQNYLQRILKFGNVMIGSMSGRDFMELNFKGIRKPREIAHKIEEMMKGAWKETEEEEKEEKK